MDGEGNRTAQTVGGSSSSFTYDSDDELTQVTGGLARWYSYNANGEQTGRATTAPGGVPAYATRSYDYDGQFAGDSSFSYAYDAAGRRVSSTTGGTATAYQYDGEAVLLEKQGGTVTASYTYGNALIRKDGETPMFDGLGSERTVTNSSGSGTGSLTLSAFGGTVTSSGSSASAYKFGATSGYRDDGDAGLVKVGCRYYDPEVGRFTTRDTDLSQKAYVYCNADPVNAVDPSGHWSLHAWFVFGGAIVGGVIGVVLGGGIIGGLILAAVGAYIADAIWDKITNGDGYFPHSP